jgi:hypothetical protein
MGKNASQFLREVSWQVIPLVQDLLLLHIVYGVSNSLACVPSQPEGCGHYLIEFSI